MAKGEYLGEFEQVTLLALAALAESGHGRRVYEEIVRTTRREVSVTAVYVTLLRLEKKGYVTSQMAEPKAERGGKSRKCFRLSTKGAEELRKARRLLDLLWEGAKLNPALGEE